MVPPSDDDGEMATSAHNAPGSTGDDPTSAKLAQPSDARPGVRWRPEDWLPHNRWVNVDSSSFTPGDQSPHYHGRHAMAPASTDRPTVDTASPDAATLDGNLRSLDRLSFPHSPEGRRCQASWAKVSRYDFAALCDPFYHGGTNGLATLSIQDIKARGYTSINSDDVVLCFNDIITLHAKVISSWSNTHSQQSGPSVKHIIEKAVPTVLPKLDGLTPADMVLFYDNLQKISSVYLLPLMPFDAINLCLGFEGLCPPGLGVHCYADICRALMEVLPCLLPCSISRVTTAVSTTCAENGNGFALLWDFLALSVPGFDLTLQI
jgi:hypothetical protein